MPAKKGQGRKKNSPNDVGVIYARYSSHNQKDASIEQQVEECRKYAAGIGLQITEVYSDRAVSGKTDNRPAFQKLLRDAEKHKFQYVVAWKSNRIGRNMLQAMVNEARLDEFGIVCLYVEEDFDDTAAGRFALRSMMNVNQFYIENMAEDIRRGMMDNARNGKITGSIPFGYKRGKDCTFEIDEPKAAIVREVYQRVSNGDNYIDIANDLNARGLKTQTGAAWNKNSFRSMLSNERYRGVYLFAEYRKEGGMPRIIDDDLFYEVQEAVRMKRAMQGRHGSTNSDYLLTGKLFCGHCGSYMTGMSGTSKTGDVHYYYSCQKHNKHECSKKNVRKGLIEKAVAHAIVDYALTDDMIEYITDQSIAFFKKKEQSSQVSILENELGAVNESIKNVMKAIEAGIITDTTRARLLELEAERAKLDGKIAAEKANILQIDRNEMLKGMRAFRQGNFDNEKFLRRLFDTFLVAVYVFDDHLRLVFSFSGDKRNLDVPIAFDSENFEEFTPSGGGTSSQGKSSSELPSPPPNHDNPNHIFPIGSGFGLFVLFTYGSTESGIKRSPKPTLKDRPTANRKAKGGRNHE